MAKKYINPLKENWKKNYHRSEDSLKMYNRRSEYNEVGESLEGYEDARRSRDTECYWGRDGGQYTSWTDRWDYLTKLVNGWRAAIDEKNPRPNLKSPFAYNVAETVMTEMYDMDFGFESIPLTPKGLKYYRAVDNIINYPIKVYGFDEVWLDAMQESAWLGNSFLETDYTKIIRKKKLKKLKSFTKEELKKLEGDDIAIYQNREIIEHNDVNWIHRSCYDTVVDAYASKMHGLNGSANEVWTREHMSLEAFKKIYGNRKGFFNIDKVKEGNYLNDYDQPLFNFPADFVGNKDVCILKHQNKAEDFVKYIANGILIGRHPLPNHGQLSIVHLGALKLPGQFYYASFADFVEGYQVEDEVMRNKFLELLDIALTPPIIASANVAGEFADQYETAKLQAGTIVTIPGDPREVQFMAPAITRFGDLMGLRTQIREDVIAVSMIDPSASSQPSVKGMSATEKVALMQATMKAFGKLLKNWSRGLRVGGKLQWALQRQEYPLQMEEEEVEGRTGEQGTFKARTIILKDTSITTEKDDVKIEKKNGYFPFEITDDYLDIDDQDIDIVISQGALTPNSRLARIKTNEQAMAQFMPILEKEAQEKGIPTSEYGPIQVLKREYVKVHNMDDDILGSGAEDKDDAEKRALDQEKIMYKNAKLDPGDDKFKLVVGIMDEPMEHYKQHLKDFVAVQGIVEGLKAEQQEQIMKLAEDIAMRKMIDPAKEKELKEMSLNIDQKAKFLNQLAEHTKVDMMKETEALAQIAGFNQPRPPQGAPMGQPPMGGQMPPQMGGQPPMDIPAPTPTGQYDLMA